MPRKSASTTMPELERQLEDDTARGLEELPEFNMPDGTPAVAPATNGQYVADADGFNVRPSEQCKAPSPLGISCTFRDFHNGRHSWGPVEETQPEQAELPGTPEPELPEPAEPEADANGVPYEAAFKGADFMSAPMLRAIAEAWISETDELGHLRGLSIRYFWRRRGGLKGGNPRLGALQKPTGITAYSLGRPAYWLSLAADHCRDLKLTPEQIRAAVLHELCKAAVDPDDHDSYRVVGPDAEIFALELRLCGLWSLDLREVGANIKQLGLLEGLDQDLALPDGDVAVDETDAGE